MSYLSRRQRRNASNVRKLRIKNRTPAHKDPITCPICLDNITKRAKKSIHLICNNRHQVHDKCMQTWLSKSAKQLCPAGCGELIHFNEIHILLEKIDIEANCLGINSCDTAILIYTNTIDYLTMILRNIVDLYPNKYSNFNDIISESPYQESTYNISYCIGMYEELKGCLEELNNIKRGIHHPPIFSYIKYLLYKKEQCLTKIFEMRHALLEPYTNHNLDALANKVKLHLTHVCNYLNNKRMSQLRGNIHIALLTKIQSSIPTLKSAINFNNDIGPTEYISFPEISCILSVHRIYDAFILESNNRNKNGCCECDV